MATIIRFTTHAPSALPTAMLGADATVTAVMPFASSGSEVTTATSARPIHPPLSPVARAIRSALMQTSRPAIAISRPQATNFVQAARVAGSICQARSYRLARRYGGHANACLLHRQRVPYAASGNDVGGTTRRPCVARSCRRSDASPRRGRRALQYGAKESPNMRASLILVAVLAVAPPTAGAAERAVTVYGGYRAGGGFTDAVTNESVDTRSAGSVAASVDFPVD